MERQEGDNNITDVRWCCAALISHRLLSSPQMQCVGPSMLPTLGLSGDVVLMWPTASGLVAPQLGDVVICTSPTDPTGKIISCLMPKKPHSDLVFTPRFHTSHSLSPLTVTVCKRVAGMPGDLVRYKWLPGIAPAREVYSSTSRHSMPAPPCTAHRHG